MIDKKQEHFRLIMICDDFCKKCNASSQRYYKWSESHLKNVCRLSQFVRITMQMDKSKEFE